MLTMNILAQSMMGEFSGLLIVAALLALGFFVGSMRERSHLRSLDRREQEYSDISSTNLRMVTSPESVSEAGMVLGEAVIATDYFKTFAAALRKLVGGELKTYETLLRRARREATLRMLEEARRMGASEVWNVRYETSNITSASRRSPGASVEVFAFGTAVVRDAQPAHDEA